jgi:hypothetical protein
MKLAKPLATGTGDFEITHSTISLESPTTWATTRSCASRASPELLLGKAAILAANPGYSAWRWRAGKMDPYR